jgi:hypothetical protein
MSYADAVNSNLPKNSAAKAQVKGSGANGPLAASGNSPVKQASPPKRLDSAAKGPAVKGNTNGPGAQVKGPAATAKQSYAQVAGKPKGTVSPISKGTGVEGKGKFDVNAEGNGILGPETFAPITKGTGVDGKGKATANTKGNGVQGSGTVSPTTGTASPVTKGRGAAEGKGNGVIPPKGTIPAGTKAPALKTPSPLKTVPAPGAAVKPPPPPPLKAATKPPTPPNAARAAPGTAASIVKNTKQAPQTVAAPKPNTKLTPANAASATKAAVPAAPKKLGKAA